MLGKLPVPGRPTILITVGQGPTVLAVGAGGGCLDIFTLIYAFSSLSARYRLKYCLNPKQPTNFLSAIGLNTLWVLHFTKGGNGGGGLFRALCVVNQPLPKYL